MFSFDAQSLKMQKQVEGLLRQLHSVATMAILNGIKLEWGLANQATDSLLKSIIGKKAMSDPTFNAWTARNNAGIITNILKPETSARAEGDEIQSNAKDLLKNIRQKDRRCSKNHWITIRFLRIYQFDVIAPRMFFVFVSDWRITPNPRFAE